MAILDTSRELLVDDTGRLVVLDARFAGRVRGEWWRQRADEDPAIRGRHFKCKAPRCGVAFGPAQRHRAVGSVSRGAAWGRGIDALIQA